MEWVLHRANALERIDRGIAAGCDRLEIDLWHKQGPCSGGAPVPDAPDTLRRYRAVDADALLLYSPRQLRLDHERGTDGPSAVSMRAAALLGRPELAERCRSKSLGVYVWDMPDRSTLEACLRHDLAGAIVSDVAWIRDRPTSDSI